MTLVEKINQGYEIRNVRKTSRFGKRFCVNMKHPRTKTLMVCYVNEAPAGYRICS